MVNTDRLLSGINWELLRAQKRVLTEMQQRFTSEQDKPMEQTIEGILNLIDSIQDTAVDDLGVEPDKVYNICDDGTGEPLISLEQALKIVLTDGPDHAN